jgi:Family of unknown function (DUF6932)
VQTDTYLKPFTTEQWTKRRSDLAASRTVTVDRSYGAKFTEFTGEVKACGLVETVLVDGSFATSKPDPNDIDIVLVLVANYDFSTDLPATVYNLLAQHRVRRRFGFDIVVVKSDSQSLNDAIDFFQQVKQRPGLKKGILRIKL